jgi:hypothetical protein
VATFAVKRATDIIIPQGALNMRDISGIGELAATSE